MGYKITKLSSLEESHLRQVTKIFGESFGQMFRKFTNDIDKLSECFGNSFVKHMFYVYLVDDKILGFLACSSISGRAVSIDSKPFERRFGKVKGKIFSWQMKKIMTRVVVKSERECYIDLLGVDLNHRRKGVGEALLNYVHNDESYDKYILEVLSSNKAAINLYEKLGYKVVREENNVVIKLSGQSPPLIMEYIK